MKPALNPLIFILSVLGGKLCAFPERIITTSPTLTEIVYSIGGERKLVATVEFSDYPSQAKAIPRIGSFFAPSIEKTLLYHPDLVLIDGAARNPGYELALERLGIQKAVVQISSPLELSRESNRMRELLGLPLATSELQVPKREGREFSYLGFVWSEPAIVFTEKTFLFSLLKSLGGKNLGVFQSSQDYVTVSKEWLILSRPEVVFFLMEFESQKEGFTRFCKEIWKEHTPKIIFLPSEKFARKTNVAVEGLNQIKRELDE